MYRSLHSKCCNWVPIVYYDRYRDNTHTRALVYHLSESPFLILPLWVYSLMAPHFRREPNPKWPECLRPWKSGVGNCSPTNPHCQVKCVLVLCSSHCSHTITVPRSVLDYPRPFVFKLRHINCAHHLYHNHLTTQKGTMADAELEEVRI